VHLLRGSHEDITINKYMGFGDECQSKLGQTPEIANSYFTMINRIFQKLPLAALVEKKIFCVHGGIGTTLRSLQ
jgi:protein phosphatase